MFYWTARCNADLNQSRYSRRPRCCCKRRFPRQQDYIPCPTSFPNPATLQRRWKPQCVSFIPPTPPFQRCSCFRTATITLWSATRAEVTAVGRTSQSRGGAKTPHVIIGGPSATSVTLPPEGSGLQPISQPSNGWSTTRPSSPKPK